VGDHPAAAAPSWICSYTYWVYGYGWWTDYGYC
jgi:hypothetical protein